MLGNKGPISLFFLWIFCFPSTIIKEAVLFPLCILGTFFFLKNQLAAHMWLHFWAPYDVLQIRSGKKK
jgi:hypothetical protein